MDNAIGPWKAAKILMDEPERAEELNLAGIAADIPGEMWFFLLMKQPQLETYFDWYKHDCNARLPWAKLLQKQPQFLPHCNWQLLPPAELLRMHFKCPALLEQQFPHGQIEELVNFLPPLAKAFLLRDTPEAEVLFSWDELNRELTEDLWLLILEEQPQFEAHFDWSRVQGKKLHFWGCLLAKQPQFAVHCDLKKLDRTQIRKLLIHQSQFAPQCDLDSLNEDDWRILLTHHADLAALKPS